MSTRPPLEALLDLVPPPPTSYEFDWALTERQLGRPLPSDYKALLEIYGPLELGLFKVFQPNRSDDNSYLASATRRLREDLDLEELPQPPAEVLALPPGVMITFDDVIRWGHGEGMYLW